MQGIVLKLTNFNICKNDLCSKILLRISIILSDWDVFWSRSLLLLFL